MICDTCSNWDPHNCCCIINIQTHEVILNPKTLTIEECDYYHEASFVRRIETIKIKAQQTLSPGGSDELDPIIKEIQEGKYSELHISLKTKDGIELQFDYPVGG